MVASFEKNRRLIGLSLIAAGLIPYLVIIGWFVFVDNKPPLILKFSLIAAFVVWFAGKTVLKSVPVEAADNFIEKPR